MMRPIVCVLMAAITSASGSESQRVRFGPGVCGPVDPIYIKGATETGGQPFPMSPTEVGKSSRIMESSLLPEMILWASGHSEASYLIPVDPSVVRIMFSGTFDATGGLLTLIAPDGTVIQPGRPNCGHAFELRTDHYGSTAGQRDLAGADSPDRPLLAHGNPKSDCIADRCRIRGTPRRAGIRSPRQNQGRADKGRPATLRVSDLANVEEADVSARVAGRTGTSVNRPAVCRRPRIHRVLLRFPSSHFACLSTVAMNPAPELSASGPDCSTVSSSRSFRRPPILRSREPNARHLHDPESRSCRSTESRLVGSPRQGQMPVDPPTLELGAGAEGITTVQLKVPADVGRRVRLASALLPRATAQPQQADSTPRARRSA